MAARWATPLAVLFAVAAASQPDPQPEEDVQCLLSHQELRPGTYGQRIASLEDGMRDVRAELATTPGKDALQRDVRALRAELKTKPSNDALESVRRALKRSLRTKPGKKNVERKLQAVRAEITALQARLGEKAPAYELEALKEELRQLRDKVGSCCSRGGGGPSGGADPCRTEFRGMWHSAVRGLSEKGTCSAIDYLHHKFKKQLSLNDECYGPGAAEVDGLFDRAKAHCEGLCRRIGAEQGRKMAQVCCAEGEHNLAEVIGNLRSAPIVNNGTDSFRFAAVEACTDQQREGCLDVFFNTVRGSETCDPYRNRESPCTVDEMVKGIQLCRRNYNALVE